MTVKQAWQKRLTAITEVKKLLAKSKKLDREAMKMHAKSIKLHTKADNVSVLEYRTEFYELYNEATRLRLQGYELQAEASRLQNKAKALRIGINEAFIKACEKIMGD